MLYPSELRGHIKNFTRSAKKMARCPSVFSGFGHRAAERVRPASN